MTISVRHLRRTVVGAVLATALGAGIAAPALAQGKTLTVFAAASLKNALDDVNTAYLKATGTRVTTSYGASSALARQLDHGAPADVFASADLEWMDYSADKKTIRDETRVNLLGNRLVLIAPRDSRLGDIAITPGFGLATLIGEGRIATGEVASVPAGKYAIAALEKLGIWRSVEKKLAMAENVRAALALVARGEAVAGIVYETDAKAEPGVKVIGAFPTDSHPAIVYPVAATANARPETATYLAFLRSAAARTIFEHYGFTFLPHPTS